MTPSGRTIVPASWALYDFANTIFSFAVVSGAIGLYLVDQFGERDGNLLLSIAVVLSVGINALVSPILGAFSDRGPGRMPFLLFFTLLCIGATFFIGCWPRQSKPTDNLLRTWSYTGAEITMPPGSAKGSSRAATITPSPNRSSPSGTTGGRS